MCGNFDCNSLDDNIYYDEEGNIRCPFGCGKILREEDGDCLESGNCKRCE